MEATPHAGKIEDAGFWFAFWFGREVAIEELTDNHGLRFRRP